MSAVSIAVHGGAGTPPEGSLTRERDDARREGLRRALTAGCAVLDAGGAALDAVVAAVGVLERDPLFNAGRGSVYSSDGTQRMDASVMCGKRHRGGAVASVGRIQSPVLAAREVLDHSPHVLLMGDGAERFAASRGLRLVDPSWFADPTRLAQLQASGGRLQLDHAGADDPSKLGTVGAVARDIHGHLAAATSTGGMTGKEPGRVGDSALLGAGTWADNATCAVSATGHGERFIEWNVAGRVAALVELAGLSLQDAVNQVVLDELPAFGAEGGLIAVDARGRLCLPFNSGGMARAARHPDGRVEVVGFLPS